jgi:GNAT acetyltransferase-like protein
MPTEIQIVQASDSYWNDLLELVPHDIYHTREYHLTSSLGLSECSTSFRPHAEDQCPQQSLLFSYQRNGMVFLFPYVLRTLEDILGYEGRSYFDVTSVYGYGGPLASPNVSPQFLREAWCELLDAWRRRGVISAFTRFHPLLQNVRFAQGIPDETTYFGATAAILCGTTVSINLLKPEAEQFQQYQKNLRNHLRRAYASGFDVKEVDLYTQTMKRRNAAGQYMIDREWLLQFAHSLGNRCSLLSATLDGETTAILLVMEYKGFVHAHLTGIDDRFTEFSPLKPLLDGTRRWAAARGNHTFHLGGGIGARQDSLFQFKRHFSPDTNPFHIGCWILNRELYLDLSPDSEREAGSGLNSTCEEPKPFPAYRFVTDERHVLATRRG